VAPIGPVGALPLRGLAPLQAPEAAQDVAFVLLQLRTDPLLYLWVIVLGFAVSLTVGATFTVTWAEVLEPATLLGNPLLQVST
jgi:hypothetical protein